MIIYEVIFFIYTMSATSMKESRENEAFSLIGKVRMKVSKKLKIMRSGSSNVVAITAFKSAIPKINYFAETSLIYDETGQRFLVLKIGKE